MSVDAPARKVSFWDTPTFIGLAIALAAVPLYLALSRLEFDEEAKTNFKNFIEWFGVPYALVLAAVLVNAWQKFEEVERDFDKEADALESLFETSLLLDEQKPNPTRKVRQLKRQIKESIQEYVAFVIDHYRDEPFDKALHKQGDDMLIAIRPWIGEAIQLKQSIVGCELLQILNDAQDTRGDRVAESRQRLKKQLWTLSLFSSVVWLFPFYALHFQAPDFPSGGLMEVLKYVTSILLGPGLIIGVTFVVVAILFIIHDLNDPFSGEWCLELDSWQELKEELEQH